MYLYSKFNSYSINIPIHCVKITIFKVLYFSSLLYDNCKKISNLTKSKIWRYPLKFPLCTNQNRGPVRGWEIIARLSGRPQITVRKSLWNTFRRGSFFCERELSCFLTCEQTARSLGELSEMVSRIELYWINWIKKSYYKNQRDRWVSVIPVPKVKHTSYKYQN